MKNFIKYLALLSLSCVRSAHTRLANLDASGTQRSGVIQNQEEAAHGDITQVDVNTLLSLGSSGIPVLKQIPAQELISVLMDAEVISQQHVRRNGEQVASGKYYTSLDSSDFNSTATPEELLDMFSLTVLNRLNETKQFESATTFLEHQQNQCVFEPIGERGPDGSFSAFRICRPAWSIFDLLVLEDGVFFQIRDEFCAKLHNRTFTVHDVEALEKLKIVIESDHIASEQDRARLAGQI